jgi:hypothetical protein
MKDTMRHKDGSHCTDRRKCRRAHIYMPEDKSVANDEKFEDRSHDPKCALPKPHDGDCVIMRAPAFPMSPVRCSKCNADGLAIPLRVEREYHGEVIGAMVVTDSLLPEEWTKIVIVERPAGSNREVVKTTVYACPKCTIEIS